MLLILYGTKESREKSSKRVGESRLSRYQPFREYLVESRQWIRRRDAARLFIRRCNDVKKLPPRISGGQARHRPKYLPFSRANSARNSQLLIGCQQRVPWTGNDESSIPCPHRVFATDEFHSPISTNPLPAERFYAVRVYFCLHSKIRNTLLSLSR